MSIPTTHQIRCIDDTAAGKLAAALASNGWEKVTTDGATVTFPCDNPGGVMAVADYAFEHDLAHDDEAARLIGGLG